MKLNLGQKCQNDQVCLLQWDYMINYNENENDKEKHINRLRHRLGHQCTKYGMSR